MRKNAFLKRSEVQAAKLKARQLVWRRAYCRTGLSIFRTRLGAVDTRVGSADTRVRNADAGLWNTAQELGALTRELGTLTRGLGALTQGLGTLVQGLAIERGHAPTSHVTSRAYCGLWASRRMAYTSSSSNSPSFTSAFSKRPSSTKPFFSSTRCDPRLVPKGRANTRSIS